MIECEMFIVKNLFANQDYKKYTAVTTPFLIHKFETKLVLTDLLEELKNDKDNRLTVQSIRMMTAIEERLNELSSKH
jgi:hypothetical protein